MFQTRSRLEFGSIPSAIPFTRKLWRNSRLICTDYCSRKANKTKLIFQAVTDGANDLFAVGGGGTAFDWAIKKNEIEIAKLILAHGGDPNAKAAKAYTYLHDAAAQNTPEIAAELLAYGANIEACDTLDGDECTPLHVAAEKGSLEVARVLVDAGANLSAQDFGKDTPLHLAVFSDQVDVAALLIARGANIEALNADRETPLHTAVYWGAPHCANLLLSHGADREARNKARKTPVEIARQEDKPDLVHLFRTGELLVTGNAPKPLQTVVSSDIFISYAEPDSALAETFYQQLQRQSYKCWMAPHDVLASETQLDATRRGVSESRVLLLLKSASSENSTPVMSELSLGNELQIPMFWIELDKTKKPILDRLSLNLRSVMTVTNAPSSPIDVNDDENIREFIDMIKEFLAIHKGVVPRGQEGSLSEDVELANKQLEDAMASENYDNYELMRMALQNGANNFSITDSDGATLLHWAILGDDLECIKYLVEKGVDVNRANDDGETPLATAIDAGVKKIITFLKKQGAK